MEIRPIRASEIDAAHRLLLENGFGRHVADPALFRQLVSRSQRALVAVEQGAVLGFARAISDDIANGYISMVVVAKDHRRKGVGSALVNAVMGEDRRISWVLRAGRPDVIPFYEKLGFVQSTVAMERPRAKISDA
jgi:ribosomal protein S18 acetylase RimI-like enzyme